MKTLLLHAGLLVALTTQTCTPQKDGEDPNNTTNNTNNPPCCTPRVPTQAEVEDSRARVEAAIRAAERVRAALELLGLLPVYTCGEPRRTFVGRAAESAQAQASCLTATAEARGDTADAIVLAFSPEGCAVRGHVVSGEAALLYNGGEERLDLAGDLYALQVDGTALRTRVGYGTCSDQDQFWAKSEGPVPHVVDRTYTLDAQLRKREGIPIIGGTTLLLDGTGSVTGPAGTDQVTITALEYEIGEYLPAQGEVVVQTATGKRVRATFRTTLWRIGKMEIQIDDAQPVTVPVLH